MIYDLLKAFKQEYEQYGDKLILDHYELKEGLYVRVLQDGKFEPFIVKKRKRELFFTNLDGETDYDAYTWFKERDYNSGYLNSNKSFYDKKIHNVNYLSLFIKQDSLTTQDVKKRLKKDAIKYQYYYLCNYKKFTKPQEKEILKTFQKKFQDRNRRKEILRKYRWIKNNLQNIVVLAQEYGVKNYIKIFFDAPLQQYQDESNIYYAIKIFNDIAYSKTVSDLVYGLSDSNMGLNSKKPFLEHKNRKLTTPFMILKEDALLTKKFFDWLKFQNLQEKKPLTNHQAFFIDRDFKEQDLIIGYDYLPSKIDKLQEPMMLKNHLLLKEKKMYIEDQKIEYLSQLEEAVDTILYNGQLKNNYYGEVYKKLDNRFQNLIYSTRDAMVNYFQKYDDRSFYSVIKKYATHFAIEHIKHSRFLSAGKCLNLKFSLLEYKNKERIMNIKSMQRGVLDKLSNSDYANLTKEEFFYLAGQIASYLISMSESHQKNGDMLEAYLRANNAQKLKRVIEMEYFKYKHAINLGYVRFNNAMSLVMAYEGNDKLSDLGNMDAFLVGVLSQNIFYIKSED